MKIEAVKKLWAYRVAKKLWGYIKRKIKCFLALTGIKVKSENKKSVSETVAVEEQSLHEEEPINTLTTKAKLRNFKATEPEI